MILWKHVVVIRCPRHGFDLHLYMGAARPPSGNPFHIHEKRFEQLLRTTHDPRRLIELMTREVPDGIDFD